MDMSCDSSVFDAEDVNYELEEVVAETCALELIQTHQMVREVDLFLDI